MGAALTILSPHRDDAVFSLYFSLSAWARRSVRIRIVNFFTVSAYAPRAMLPLEQDNADQQAVSYIRRREDRQAFRRINPNIEVSDLGLLDAPIRLNLAVDAVCKLNDDVVESGHSGDLVKKHICKLSSSRLFLAPLGLGNHVDHLAVRAAALEQVPGSKLAFYEDLPYATWTPETSLRQRVSEVERAAGFGLKPRTVNGNSSVPAKLRELLVYSSQITREEGRSIARFAIRYRTWGADLGPETQCRLAGSNFLELWRKVPGTNLSQSPPSKH